MKSKKILALVVARGGSKGIPRKNLLIAQGRPLISWTIDAALNSKFIDDVFLSSDDDEIIDVSQKWGCNVSFKRPASLATDSASSLDVVMHALDELPGYEYIVLLQPTSPLRTTADIDAAFDLLFSKNAPSCVSVCKAEQSPYWMYRLEEGEKLRNLIPSSIKINRRQDLPSVYMLNGAIYIASIQWLRKTKAFISEDTVAYVMSKYNSIDIDTIEDFKIFQNHIFNKSIKT